MTFEVCRVVSDFEDTWFVSVSEFETEQEAEEACDQEHRHSSDSFVVREVE